LLVATVTGVVAQPNKEQYDNKWIHFGFSLTMNNASLRVDPNYSAFQKDSLRNVRQASFPGIGLGALTNFRLGKSLDIRVMFPQISFAQRNLTYNFDGSQKVVKIESAYCDGSILLKYKSARRRNIRAYVIGGLKMSYDLASTEGQNRSLNSPVVSLKPITYGHEAGFGLDIYFPYFKLSPEIKFSNTIWNAMIRDGYVYTNAINKITPQMVVFSLHFE
jgi:Outer membrane protein beta-barrel domain